MSDSVWLYRRESDDYVFSVHRTKEGAEAKRDGIEAFLKEHKIASAAVRIEEYELEL